MPKQRILVVDDDKQVVRLMRAYLEQAGYEVLAAYDGETAVHALRREKPDLVLLDLMLPDRDGYDITRLVRGDPSLAKIPIIMLTARVEDTDKIIGLELGADDYVTKPYNPREVVARVRARLRSQESYQPRVLRAGGLEMDVERRQVLMEGEPVELTPTEFNLLRVLLEQAGYVFTRAELIRRGLGVDYEGLDRTLDSHMRNLRRKIEPDPRHPTYIQTVYGVGYRLVDEAQI
jgi:two-component system alkaline phosphatase synthesis response regulator PhoP